MIGIRSEWRLNQKYFVYLFNVLLNAENIYDFIVSGYFKNQNKSPLSKEGERGLIHIFFHLSMF